MNPDSVPQEFYEDAAARDAYIAAMNASISSLFQDLLGKCMLLEADLRRKGDPISEVLVQRTRVLVVRAAALLEIPVEVKE